EVGVAWQNANGVRELAARTTRNLALEEPRRALRAAVRAHGSSSGTGNVAEVVDKAVEQLDLDVIRTQAAEVDAGLHLKLGADLHGIGTVGLHQLDANVAPVLGQLAAPLGQRCRALEMIADETVEAIGRGTVALLHVLLHHPTGVEDGANGRHGT